ncbi:uncharacterized protein KGF55_005064 [Candida pseudojiufengensis]|uniref:uncharacterized protein n=1 Tax=Candida pseudojiufengensis TaxID=497109 RepID=UPI00222452C2|nr:uncharacterized protein KGF55_005064 [Candida pseudojiufengensis]KAI5959832.1 hypothetical protein KGF55_005064 [Candida pseudojiufengensis]
MSIKLPSITDSDFESIYALDEKDYIFNPNNDIPIESLINYNLPIPQEYSGHSIKIPGTSKPGYSEIYRNASLPNNLKNFIVPELNTYHALIKSSVERHGDSSCLAYHEYDYENDLHLERYNSLTYNEVNNKKINFASGLFFLINSNPFKNLELESHLKIINHERDYQNYNENNMSFIVTFYSGNRIEWIISDLACSSNSLTSTALYDTLGESSSKYILEITQSPIIICSRNKIEKLIELKKQYPKELESLIMIISMDPLNKKASSLTKLAEENNIKLYDFIQVEKIGEIFPHTETLPKPETTYTLTFTSGTTSNPKGVVLPHRTIVAACLSFAYLMPHHNKMKEFAFLPLAHIFERHMSASVLTFGGEVAFPRLGGSAITLFQDLKLYKPTFLACVPRIFSKIESLIKNATIDSNSTFNRITYSQAFETKRIKQLEDGNKGNHFIYDTILIKRLRSLIGFDNMEVCFTGGAPISGETIKFLRSSLGIGFTQGYGSSESFAGMLMALPLQYSSIGTCGAIAPTVEARIREIPEMGYYLNDKGGPRGELQLRGPQMFSHYYKNPEETSKSIDSEGWFSTGDVIQITNEGWFIIFDRVKNFYKLSQGEYVTPEKIENLYLTSNSIITQVFAHGDFNQSYLVGVIGIDPLSIKTFLTSKCNIQPDQISTNQDLLEVVNKREIKTSILLYLNTNVGSKLNGFEKIQNIYLEIDPLTLDRNVITPTSKLKRSIASNFFKNQIDMMYKEGSIIKDLKL